MGMWKESGGVPDMGLHSHYPGWPKGRGSGRYSEVEFEESSQEERGVDRGLGAPGRCFIFSPCPRRSPSVHPLAQSKSET